VKDEPAKKKKQQKRENSESAGDKTSEEQQPSRNLLPVSKRTIGLKSKARERIRLVKKPRRNSIRSSSKWRLKAWK